MLEFVSIQAKGLENIRTSEILVSMKLIKVFRFYANTHLVCK